MDSEISVNEKSGNYDVVVEIQVPGNEETSSKNDDLQGTSVSESNGESSNVELTRMQMNLFQSTATPAQVIIPTPTQTPDPSAKPPIELSIPQKSIYSKPKSRIAEPPYPKSSKPAEEIVKTAPEKSPDMSASNLASPSLKANRSTPRTSAPSTPKTPLMASIGGVDDNDDDDDDDEVYKTENLKVDKVRRGKKMDVLTIIEWIVFVCIMAVLIASLTVNKLKGFQVWSLEFWKWCVFVLVIFCGRLFTEWLSNILGFLIEKNFLLKKKVLYFLFALKKSVRVVIWLALILLAWVLLINRGVQRSEETAKILNHITRGIVSTLVGAVLWMVKTFLIKLVASTFHVRTYFDRIQESLFHQYIFQALSGTPKDDGNDISKISCQLSFNNAKTGKQEKEGEVIDVDKLYKMKRDKVSAWTMGGLTRAISNSGLPTLSDVLDESVEEAWGEKKEITSEIEARDAANRIFSKVAKHGHKYIEEDDLLRFMPKDKVDNALPLFEGAAESRRIKKSSFRNWVVKAYNERKCLAASLNDAKTAIEELNRIASGLVLVVIVILWLLLMEITTTKVLVFISSQLLLVVFMFGNTARTVFESIIFIFVVHPFDVGDRCVIDGVQMVVDEMNILSTIFLKSDNEKVYYPNSVLATRPISNFNRSPEMMGDSVEFAVDLSTSVESIAALKAKIKAYLESKPQHWSPNHSVQIKEIEDAHKLQMALYVTHTINFQNSGEKANRRSDLVFELKKILEELGIKYSLPPQEVRISYVEGAIPPPTSDAH